MAEAERYRLADARALDALLDRLARRVLARDGKPDLLLGIRRRGAPLAHALAARLALGGAAPVVQEIGLRRYADDLTLLHPEIALEAAPQRGIVQGARVLLVDDVLYTGRTMLRATTWCTEHGADGVRAVVVCARGGREVPLAADHVGLHLEVGEATVIEVHVPPFEPEAGIVLSRRAGA